MRAHAVASAVGLQGSATPSTQISGVAPNIDTRSVSPNTSGVPAAPKLGNAKPLGFGARPVSCDVPVASGTVTSGPAVEAPPPPPHAAKRATTDAVAITFK